MFAKILLRKCLDQLLNIFLIIAALLALWIFSMVFLFASFRIPSDSMEPTLEEGDYVLVNKLWMGARLFDLSKAMDGERVKIYRLPGLRSVVRNDVLVFHFPHPHSWDKIEMHLLMYYVKRCIALPGDSVSIHNGHYHVQGYNGALGNLAAQTRIERMGKKDFAANVYDCFPFDSTLNWNIQEFGPFYVPKAGDTIRMNRRHYVLYKKVIEWEQRATLTYRDSIIYLNDMPISGYRFQSDYYFVGGDHAENSQDSRYWGLLPEEYIVGKVWKIWKSVDPYTGEFRWNRFMKGI